jgi:BlaI family transcriptional regulator, penicillinase repressor
MSKEFLPKPTDGELAILQVLWQRGPCTVRQVHEHLARDTGYTTVLKLLQIMTDKGLVRRDESQRSHVYAAAQPAQATQRQLLADLADKAFAGSAAQLVLQALSAQRATPGELAEIRKLLDTYEKHRPHHDDAKHAREGGT